MKNLMLTAIVTAIGLSACSATPPAHMMNIHAGEEFELKQAIQIPAGKARSYIQSGKLSGSGFNQYEPHCRLETKELQAVDTIIQPEVFTISKVEIGEEQIAGKIPPAGIQFAFVGNAMASDDYQRIETMDYVHLYLKSDKQPNVYRLTCAGSLSNGDMFDAPRSYRPQREQVNTILGSVGHIQP